ncbi:MAG: 7-carboxy-7-deazaguanine synthase QueE [Acidiferrobacterales bacterium]|nr:7-carboxy-7-deazaguanine synthase QueE [Acidiferrobacterales bacterium]
MSLKVTEIFYSIQGESRTVGLPTTFVRLTGCPMRCVYCDTAYAFHGGSKMQIDEILAEVANHNTPYVTITGGEPMAQNNVHSLMTTLCEKGYQVSLETGNAIDISKVDQRVYIVLDIKTPASGEEPNNKYENLDYLKQTDCLKFVIADKEDYQWSKQQLEQRGLNDICEVFFSPSADQLPAQELADWIVHDQIPVRLQIQLHKYLWNNEAGR